MRLLLFFAAVAIVMPLAAQTLEPEYQFRFTPDTPSPGISAGAGKLEVSAVPPDLEYSQVDSKPPVPVEFTVRARVYSGRWLVDKVSEEDLTDEERFVRAKFNLFQTALQPEQYREWLDAETYSVFERSVADGEINLAMDRDFYLQFDSIRLLGSVQYGVYILLYTQFQSVESGELMVSVMPVRQLGSRLVTAGSMHATSHELYRMLAFGSLQRQLMDYLESLINN